MTTAFDFQSLNLLKKLTRRLFAPPAALAQLLTPLPAGVLFCTIRTPGGRSPKLFVIESYQYGEQLESVSQIWLPVNCVSPRKGQTGGRRAYIVFKLMTALSWIGPELEGGERINCITGLHGG